MSLPALIQYALFLIIILVLAKPLGGYMARVFQGQNTPLDVVLRPIEQMIYRVTRVNEAAEMNWKEYALAFIIFGLVGTVATYFILRLQSLLPYFGLIATHLT